MKRTSQPQRPLVTADGDGVVGHAGNLLLQELADRLGLTRALSASLASSFGRWRQHDPGTVVRDLAVMLADGGDCLSDLCVLRDHPDLFGIVASDATAWRVIDGLEGAGLTALRQARAHARRQAWAQGMRPQRLILDIDATIVIAHSEKEDAAPTWKRTFGFHPMLCFLDGTEEPLGGRLRPGNATANQAQDQLDVLDDSLAQLPSRDFPEPGLVRGDSASGTHAFVEGVRDRGLRFSVGFDIHDSVRQAILRLPEDAWVPAIAQDGEERDGAAVAELPGHVVAGWPVGTRAICRREIPHPGAQLRFTDHNGYRFQVFITDQDDHDIAYLEALHRSHARIEDRIRCGKQTGLRNLPFRDFASDEVWLELVLMATDLMAWTRHLLLPAGTARRWEPKRLRYCLFHVSGRLCHSGRRLHLRLQRSWRWVGLLVTAFSRLRGLPWADTPMRLAALPTTSERGVLSR